MNSKHIIPIALADDHAMFRLGLISVLKTYGDFEILFDAGNGKDFLEILKKAEEKPSVCIIDINMPIMHGYDTVKLIKQSYPTIRVLALSMYDEETNIIQMLRSGADGYVLKDSEPNVLAEAIRHVHRTGSYDSELITQDMRSTLKKKEEETNTTPIIISGKELEFLKLACTELTYKEIATTMEVSQRTIDGYRDRLFSKLGVKSRIGLVTYALRFGHVSMYK